MLSVRFGFFIKDSFIKVSMEQLKNKECKRRYNKISNLRKFILSRSLALKHSWSWTLVLALHCYCGDNVK